MRRLALIAVTVLTAQLARAGLVDTAYPVTVTNGYVEYTSTAGGIMRVPTNDMPSALRLETDARLALKALKSDPDWQALLDQDAAYTNHYATAMTSISNATSYATVRTAMLNMMKAVDDTDSRARRLRKLLKTIVENQP
jgi:hypothetical protein